MATTEGRVA